MYRSIRISMNDFYLDYQCYPDKYIVGHSFFEYLSVIFFIVLLWNFFFGSLCKVTSLPYLPYTFLYLNLINHPFIIRMVKWIKQSRLSYTWSVKLVFALNSRLTLKMWERCTTLLILWECQASISLYDL